MSHLKCENCGTPIQIYQLKDAGATIRCEGCNAEITTEGALVRPPKKQQAPIQIEQKETKPARSFSDWTEIPDGPEEDRIAGVRFIEKEGGNPESAKPATTKIELEIEPGKRFYFNLPGKTPSKFSFIFWLLNLKWHVVTLGLLVYGIGFGSFWFAVLGGVLLGFTLLLRMGHRIELTTERVMIEGGVFNRALKRGKKIKENQILWKDIESIKVGIYIDMETADGDADFGLNFSKQERCWIFAELKKFARGLKDKKG